MPGWRNGRRCGLKIRFPQGSVGSNPTLGTNSLSLIILPPLCVCSASSREIKPNACAIVSFQLLSSARRDHRDHCPSKLIAILRLQAVDWDSDWILPSGRTMDSQYRILLPQVGPGCKDCTGVLDPHGPFIIQGLLRGTVPRSWAAIGYPWP